MSACVVCDFRGQDRLGGYIILVKKLFVLLCILLVQQTRFVESTLFGFIFWEHLIGSGISLWFIAHNAHTHIHEHNNYSPLSPRLQKNKSKRERTIGRPNADGKK